MEEASIYESASRKVGINHLGPRRGHLEKDRVRGELIESCITEWESHLSPPHAQKIAHEELSEKMEDLQKELREVRRNIG